MGDVLEHVADCGKLVFAPRTVNSVIDRDKMHAKIGEQHIGVETDLQIITPETGHIFDDNALDFSSFYIGKHTLKSGTVEVCTGIPVVLVIMSISGNSMLPAVPFQNLLLVGNTVALAL